MQIQPCLLPKTLEGSPPPSPECTLLSTASTTLTAQPHHPHQPHTLYRTARSPPPSTFLDCTSDPCSFNLEPASHPTGSGLMPTHPSTFRSQPPASGSFCCPLTPVAPADVSSLWPLLPRPCTSIPLNCNDSLLDTVKKLDSLGE